MYIITMQGKNYRLSVTRETEESAKKLCELIEEEGHYESTIMEEVIL